MGACVCWFLSRYGHGLHPARAPGALGARSGEPGFLASVPDVACWGVLRGVEKQFSYSRMGSCTGQCGRWGHVPARSDDGCEFSFTSHFPRGVSSGWSETDLAHCFNLLAFLLGRSQSYSILIADLAAIGGPGYLSRPRLAWCLSSRTMSRSIAGMEWEA